VLNDTYINSLFHNFYHLINICHHFAALVSRQYVDMSRIRIEGLLATFPKLVGSGKQHTYVETDNVRYVYQPMETLYLLLVTNKQSNILEDRDTLQLLSKLVSSMYLSAFGVKSFGKLCLLLNFLALCIAFQIGAFN